MLTLSSPVYFGKENRFKAYQFDRERFYNEWIESYGVAYPSIGISETIFVQDNENFDAYGLPEIVFQEWSSEIESLDQVKSIVLKRFPDNS